MKKCRNEELCIRAQSGDTAAQDKLLENNIGIIRKFAHEAYEDMNLKNSDLGLDLDDLVQEGSIGLLEAIPLYDPEWGTKFLSFAAPFIRNAMTDLVRSVLSQYEQRLIDRGEKRIYLDDEELDDEWHKRILSIPDPQATMPEAYCIEKESIYKPKNRLHLHISKHTNPTADPLFPGAMTVGFLIAALISQNNLCGNDRVEIFTETAPVRSEPEQLRCVLS